LLEKSSAQRPGSEIRATKTIRQTESGRQAWLAAVVVFLVFCVAIGFSAMSKKPASISADVNAMTFEQAMGHLEEIIRRIESGEIGLEQSIAEYERGVALVKRCEAVLGQAEQRVKEVGKELLASRPKGSARDETSDEDDDAADDE